MVRGCLWTVVGEKQRAPELCCVGGAAGALGTRGDPLKGNRIDSPCLVTVRLTFGSNGRELVHGPGDWRAVANERAGLTTQAGHEGSAS
jgi:hypothetical protein